MLKLLQCYILKGRTAINEQSDTHFRHGLRSGLMNCESANQTVLRFEERGCVYFKCYFSDPKAFRVFVQLPDIPASSSITSFDADPQKDRLITFMSDYVSRVACVQKQKISDEDMLQRLYCHCLCLSY